MFTSWFTSLAPFKMLISKILQAVFVICGSSVLHLGAPNALRDAPEVVAVQPLGVHLLAAGPAQRTNGDSDVHHAKNFGGARVLGAGWCFMEAGDGGMVMAWCGP